MCAERRGFTLYEILLATVILAMGLLASLALFPKAVETQKLARQKILAAALATDLMAIYATGKDQNGLPGYDDFPLARSVYAPDLERLGTKNKGLALDRGSKSGGDENAQADTRPEYLLTVQESLRTKNMDPVPPEILARLDSDHDEIRRLSEMGAPLYYLRPYVVDTGVVAPGGSDSIQEANRELMGTLVFGVVGYPQMNAHFHNPGQYHFRNVDSGVGTGTSYSRRDVMWGGETYDRDNYYDVNQRDHEDPFVWPFKYYLWDYEVYLLDSYNAWNKRGEPMDRYGEDVDSAFPLRRRETNSLYMPFAPAERCRQIVFWSVPWKDYEDAETLEPAPEDIGLWNTNPGSDGGVERFWKSKSGREHEFAVRLPHPSGTGHYWDRNWNQKLDRGTIPKAVRMRAQTVARFSFYDKRIHTAY